jgi:hypothetical protein
VEAIDLIYLWVDLVVWIFLCALRAWAIIDCIARKSAAFPAANKLTKPAWLAILVVSGFLGSYFSLYNPTGVLSLISTVVTAVYLADVRPAIREITGGRW